jgi:hypothetical protein
MKKIKITNSTRLSDMVELTAEDGPQYPLLDFKGFDTRNPSQIQPTRANNPRKTERTKGNLEVLVASTKEGWAVKRWPLSIFSSKESEELFDARHTLAAVKINQYPVVPAAIYTRKKTGNDLLDGLKDSSVMTLMGLYANADDGTTNAVQNDFINAVKMVIQDEGLPLTRDNVDELLNVTGIHGRYATPAPITAVRNAILDRHKKSTKVFNTTKEEQKDWIKSNTFFGNNNYCPLDGVAVRSKVLDSQFVYRYAGDILRYGIAAFVKQETVRVLVMSRAEHEQDIETERKEIIEVMSDTFLAPINFYRVKLTQFFGTINMKLQLPEIQLTDLPMEVWAMPQIEGEDEAMQLM